ncbi:11938_t:CDS:2, partial [Racocetra persica]
LDNGYYPITPYNLIFDKIKQTNMKAAQELLDHWATMLNIAKNILTYYANEFENRDITIPLPLLLIEQDAEQEYEGYLLYDTTWESVKNLKNCDKLVKVFKEEKEFNL